ncbi:uncharacterized protein At4g26485-like isoform X1 [Aristolochia californica]|uniref:uncharacterized protein At4g26485-like isoform X1 n=1 Tax=Aristolochia californica TaxID=171875 RepID=UPI0035DBBB4A
MDATSEGSDRKREQWITHYCSSQRILLVGEGDFSFSACLAECFGSARNMVATSLDSEGIEMFFVVLSFLFSFFHPYKYASIELLKVKHWTCVPHLVKLKRLGCVVLHEVDVKEMHRHPVLRTMRFDRIVFNFPHAGHFPLLCERHGRLIKLHKKLLSAFFGSAREMLAEDGEVHVAHRDDYPYNCWKLENLAKKAGMHLIEAVEFRKVDYPGYHNKRGGGIKSNKKFPLKECFTFKFSLKK